MAIESMRKDGLPDILCSALSLGTDGAVESCRLIWETPQSEYFAITYWSDGLRVKGFLGLPKRGSSLPAVIYNRGGNRELGTLKGKEIVPFVEYGCVTVASQYRGNAGGEGREEFGGADINDVLNLIPLLQKLPHVDRDRIGMVGISRGGMMAYQVLKWQTLRGSTIIKAAATIGGITDVADYVQTRPDIRPVCETLIGSSPEQDPEAYRVRSAVHWPELITAPLLLQHGGADWRVQAYQARRLSDLLTRAGKTVQLLIYPDDDHEISGHGGGIADALAWLQRYIGGPEIG